MNPRYDRDTRRRTGSRGPALDMLSRSRRRRQLRRRVNTRLTVEPLEQRWVLAGLVGVDFDINSASVPANWTSVGTVDTPQTFTDLADEDGIATPFDLQIREIGSATVICGQNQICAGEATPTDASLPIHHQSLAAIDGQIYTDVDPLTMTWSDLSPGVDYEIYVFGLEGFYPSIQQDVRIVGAGTPITFAQNFSQDSLFINDEVGSDTRLLSSYAEIVTADASGEITVEITPRAFTLDVALGGVAIREVSGPMLEVTIVADSISESSGVGATTALVSRNTDTSNELVVSLASSDDGEAVVPGTVTIPAGQSVSPPFALDAVDDAETDGTQVVTITAVASGHADGTDTIDVTDDDQAVLSITIDAPAVSEVDGAGATSATVSRNSDTTNTLTVNLSSSDTGEATVPASITIPAGQSMSEAFLIAAVDDTIDDGTAVVMINATADSHLGASGVLQVVDDDVDATLTLAIAADSVSEGDGAGATTATVSRSTGLMVNRVDRGVVTYDAASGHQSHLNEAAGNFDATILHEGPVSSTSVREADQNSTIDEFGIDGIGAVGVADETGLFGSISDASYMDVYFDLATSHQFTLSGEVLADSVDADTWASVELTGPGIGLGFLESSDAQTVGGRTVIEESGVLIPGTYHLVARAEVSASAADILADAEFVFDLQLVPDQLDVTLASDDTGEATVPATVTIPAGQATSPVFEVDAVDDTLIDALQVVTVTASAAAHLDGTDALEVTDDEDGMITLTIDAAEIAESDGAAATMGTVSRNSIPDGDLVVTLTSSDTSEVTVPPSVIIPAGQLTSESFPINAVEDVLADGTQTVTITGAAANHAPGSRTIAVTDNDPAILTLEILSDEISENGGSTIASVTRNTDTSVALEVTLVSSDPGEAAVPTTVTIDANQDTATFDITGVDETAFDGTQTVTITATAAGHTGAVDWLDVTDDDTPRLTLEIVADSISEAAGAAATKATVSRDHDIDNALVVTLASGDPSEVAVQSTITIAGGQSVSPMFDLDAVNDILVDGAVTVTITASAMGFVDGVDTVVVNDDEVAGISVSQSDQRSLVFEDGTTDTFSVVLDGQPLSEVVINVSRDDTTEVMVQPATLAFDDTNWDQPQSVTVTGLNDSEVDGDQVTIVTLSVSDADSDDRFDNVSDQTVSVTTRDVDAAVGGIVWDDENGNQTRDTGEAGLADVTLYLDINRNGVFDSDEPTTLTDTDGSYLFDEVSAGQYVVAQQVPQGYAQSFPQVSGQIETFAEFVTDVDPANQASRLLTHATHAPRDVSRLFILEKGFFDSDSGLSLPGRIRILDLTTGNLLPTPFLTIEDTDGEFQGGLTGLAFHPDFASNGKFYVYVSVDHADPNSPFSSHVREYRVSDGDPNLADPLSKREILSFAQPTATNNGGWLGFGPNDGYLYVSSGDGGIPHDGDNYAQSLDRLLGKILRIDVDGDDFPNDPQQNYAIPSSNPFAGDDNARSEIWAYGLRNPWKASFDAGGDLYIGDVGQDSFEEINRQPASSAGGENYGWRLREGMQATPTGPFGGPIPPGNVDPILVYANGSGPDAGVSVVGGLVYRGPIPEFQQRYIFADAGSNNLWAVDPDNPNGDLASQRINDQLPTDQNTIGDGLFGFDIVALAEDGSGNLYIIQYDGDVHRISKNLPGTHTVIAVGGQTLGDVDFGTQDPQASQIGDFVWEDLNANGIHETGEPGLAGVTVHLLDPENISEPIATTTSASGGFYSFPGLAAGDYVVQFVASPPLAFSPGNQGNDSLDSDADPATGRTGVISIGASTVVDTLDAGMYRSATIGDWVWDDVDANGIQDAGEPGLSGAQVELFGRRDDFDDGTLQGWTTAPANPNPPQILSDSGPEGTGDRYLQFSSTGSDEAGGRLVIRNLEQWTGDSAGMLGIDASINNLGTTNLLMRIAVNGAGGWWVTSNDAAQSIPAGSGWTPVRFRLDAASLTNQFEPESENEEGTDLAATLGSISEIRILHNDQPNFRGDPILASAGIADITAVLDSTTTSGDGNYAFSVAPGTYRLKFTLPTDRYLSPVDRGIDDLVDSDADWVGTSHPITVGSGDVVQGVDAGMYQLASIGDRVWDDIDGDGIQDADEPGLASILVDLLGPSDDFQDATPMGWTTAGPNPNPPQNLADGGPAGNGDAFLQFSSNGTGGPGGRLIVRNQDQWTGDQQIVAIRADMSNFGGTELLMRVAVNGPGGWWVTTNEAAQSLPAGSGWTPLVFAFRPGDFTNQFETESENEGGWNLAATLAGVTELRLLHNDQPNFRADPIVASAGLDNVTAVVDTTTTSGDGLYNFAPRPGTYRAAYSLPAGRIFSPGDRGTDDRIDSDASELGITPSVTVLSAESDLTLDVGIIEPALKLTVAASSISEGDGLGATTGIVIRNTPTSTELIVQLASSDDGEAKVPASVTIPIGQTTSAPFSIDAIDDTIVDLDQNVQITATADGHSASSISLEVTDNERRLINVYFVSFSTSGRVGDIPYDDEDILAFDTTTGQWSMYFDGSNVGLGRSDVNAFHVLADGSILMSFDANTYPGNLGLVRDSDIVKFNPTGLGVLTEGSFQWFLDGSDVGLNPTSGDLDAIGLTPDGRLYTSFPAALTLPGLTVDDEDLLVLDGGEFGEATSGTWSLYFDGSDVGLAGTDVWGSSIEAATGNVYLTTDNGFSTGGLSGDGADILLCEPTSVENDTDCTFSLALDGGSQGIAAGQSLDGIQIGVFTGNEVLGKEVIYMSAASNITAGGVATRDEDIFVHDTRTGAWRMFFDGSDVGITSDVDGFHIQDDGSVLMSFNTSTAVTGLGTVFPQDIVRFVPSSTGEVTAGSFAMYFDGSDVELTTSAEGIDAIGLAEDGNLLVSTTSSYNVGGLSGRDADLLKFIASDLGPNTAGTWQLYFDGSDVELTSSSEDITGVTMDPVSGELYFTTVGTALSGGVRGTRSDIFICAQGTFQDDTSCTMELGYDGSIHGLTQTVDAIHVVRPVDLSGADLAISKSDLADPVTVGDQVTYRLTISNLGPEAADNVVVTDLVPSGGTFVSATSPCIESAQGVTCNFGQLDPGDSVLLDIVLATTQVGQLSSTATVSADTEDPHEANNSVTETTDVDPPQADLSLAITDMADPVTVGDAITYSVSIANHGPEPAESVVVTQTLPSSLVFESSTGPCGASGGVVMCNVGSLGDGESIGFEIVVTTTQPGPVSVNTSVTSTTVDLDTANNARTESTTVLGVGGPTEIAFVSFSTSGRVGEVPYDDEDILALDLTTGQWSMYFDGSNVGLASRDLNAFHVQDDGSILMSFDANAYPGDLGLVRDSDIVKFNPTAHGVLTEGSFEWFFDGSDVGLNPTSGDVDAISFTSDGRVVVSLAGNPTVAGTPVANEDLLVLNNGVLAGDNTSGDWGLHFDGSDVGLASKNVWGSSIDSATGDIFLTTGTGFSAGGIGGDGADILLCHPISIGDETDCTFSLTLDGSSQGVTLGQSFDGIQIGSFTGNEVFGQELIYMSTAGNITIGGLTTRDEDVFVHDTRTGAWRMFFDGSDLGITGDVDGFHMTDDGSALMSFNASTPLPGIGTVLPPDIVRFVPSSTGDVTAGTFELYFDGSDVGLTTSSEDVDAIGFAPDGSLLVSTLGSYVVDGFSGKDTDLLKFTASSTGENTMGSWQLYFDGSDVELTLTTEDITGVTVSSISGEIHYTTLGTVAAGGAGGNGSDILVCSPGMLHDNTSCAMALAYDGSTHGLTQTLDAIHVLRMGLPVAARGIDEGDETLAALAPSSDASVSVAFPFRAVSNVSESVTEDREHSRPGDPPPAGKIISGSGRSSHREAEFPVRSATDDPPGSELPKRNVDSLLSDDAFVSELTIHDCIFNNPMVSRP